MSEQRKTYTTPIALGIMAISNRGETLNFPNEKHPRAALLDKLGRKHADKMYVDTKDGKVKHIGYIIAGQWWTLYNVCEWSKQA